MNTDADGSKKRGMFSRLFGKGGESAAEARPQPEPGPTGTQPVEPVSWWRRLSGGLSRTSQAITQGVSDVFTKRKLDALTLDELEDVLLRADLGVGAATRIVEAVGKARYERDIAPKEVRAILAREVEATLEPIARPFEIDENKKPFVVLVVGVNGSGKTTTIAKLASKWTGEGRRVVLAAGDTFRAAAVAQLQIWGARLGAEVVSGNDGADAAGLAFDAINRARETGADILLMDTAGRLQNRAELMAELEKIVRVMRKAEAGAPHAVLLVLDATVGQNALTQVDAFARTAGVTGLVMTKLDGTARGGILVAIADAYGLPIHFIGVGEGANDLEPFTARDFARAIAGLDQDDDAEASTES
jgi:fused signal recognition particle receptor